MNVREWALPVYTILMQLGCGALFVLWMVRASNLEAFGERRMDAILRRPVLAIFFTLLTAIIGAHFHLSDPMLSFLAVLNIKYSWLSREIMFTVLTLLTCAALVDQVRKPDGGRQRLKTMLGWGTVLLGGAGIYCMASIYRLPTQPAWDHWTTSLLFFGSALLLGVVSATALLVMDAVFSREHDPALSTDLYALLKRSYNGLAKLGVAILILVILLNLVQVLTISRGSGQGQISLALLLGLYQPLLWMRFAALLAGVGLYSAVAHWPSHNPRTLAELVVPVYTACLLVLMGEILGRFLFYATHVRIGL